MDLDNFDVNKYVEEAINKINVDNLSVEEYDKFLEKNKSLFKSVSKLLKYFKLDERPTFFLPNNDHILAYFPLNKLAEKDIKRFLDHMFWMKEKINDKIIAQINKINVNNVNDLVEGKYRNYDFICIGEIKQTQLDDIVKDSIKRCRSLIRNKHLSLEQIQTLSDEIYDIFIMLMSDKNHYNLCLYARFVSDILLQILNHWVITNDISLMNKENILFKIEQFIDENKSSFFEKEIIYKNNKSINVEDTTATFAALLKQRNEFGEYLRILDILEEEEKTEPELFMKVSEKYRVKKTGDYDGDYDAVKTIITEGINVDEYNNKLENAKEFIEFFSKYGTRNANVDCIMDLKVYFREIYMSNSKYKVQASTIARKYLEVYRLTGEVKSFEKESEYIFFREKISRGYFRETGFLPLYNKKNSLQKKLYDAILIMFLTYDYERTMNLLYSFTCLNIQVIIKEISLINSEGFF